MGLFSFFRKNKQESASGQGEFLSRSATESATTRNRNTNTNARKSSSRAGKDESVDPVLPEKKRARRRLIGAIALVLAVVIVLPMILDSEPRPLANDIAIQIPSKDGKDAPVASATPDIRNGNDGKSTASDAKEELVDPNTLAPSTEKPAIAPGAAAMPSGPANPAPAAAPVTPAPPAPAVVDKVEPPKPKVEPKVDVRETKPKAAEHKDEHKKDAAREGTRTKSADKSDKADGDNARALAILEGKSGSGDKKPAAAGGKFVIQVAALATQDKIDELRGKLSNAGIKSFTQKVATQAGERTRIRVGPFGNRDEADKMRAKINKLGLNATIVPT